MKILGISPLDKDSTASIVVDGRVLFAAGEERFSRVKQHSGFPHQAIRAALEWTGTSPDEIDAVAYAFLPWDKETELIQQSLDAEAQFLREFREPDLQPMLDAAEARVPHRTSPVHGLKDPNQRMDKGSMKELFYRFAGGERGISRSVALRASAEWGARASADHKKWQEELEAGLRDLGLLSKLKRGEHHLSHSANAYLASGFERALIVTLDGYGSGLAGSVSLGENGKIRRLHNLKFPHSLGSFYEMVTSSLGFHPDRHAGKIVGLAAYGDPKVLADVLLARVKREPGDFKLVENLNVRFAQHLAARFPMIDVAAAYQYVLEVLATELVRHWARQTGCSHVVLSGGVTANVKMNQRIHELDEVEATFVYPNMGDGGCGSGLAMLYSWPGGTRETIRDVYWGPSYTPEQIEAELKKASLRFERPADLTGEVARRIHAGEVIGRCDGRMEYGPRALGNRTIMYHAREPEVNQWLNKRLGRTEFMPFAPVTLWEARERCYVNLAGAEHAAEFMTMTFDCTPFMRANCPAAVHVDGTARPQLIRREINPGYYDILKEYEKLSGIPSLINTSFNMHEEPIVCSPNDAVRAFLLGNIDGLAIGPYFVPHPDRADNKVGATSRKNEPARAGG